MAWGRPLLVMLLTALAAAAPAHARTDLGGVPDVAGDPYALAVTPGALVYSSSGDFEPYGVFEQRSRGAVRRLRQFDSLGALRPPRGSGDLQRIVAVAASRQLVAVSVSTYGVSYEGEERYTKNGPAALAVARPRGRAVRLEQCRTTAFGPVAVSGTVVAYFGPGCDEDALGVRDTATGARRVLRPPARGDFVDLRLAGRFVAALIEGGPSDGDVIVYDWRGGRVAYRASGEPFALQDDGKLATLGGGGQPGCQAGDAIWFSPSEPRPHVLEGTGCDEDAVFIANDLVLSSRFAAPPAERHDDAQAEFVVTDLAGTTTTPLFTSQIGPASPRFPVYFDGTRVGYSTPRCDGGERIVIDTIAELMRGGPAGQELCTVSLRRIPAEVRVGRRFPRFALDFACRHGCEGYIRLWDPAEQRHVPFYGGDYANLGAPASRTARHELELGRTDAERLRRLGRLDLELRVEVLQIAGGSIVRTRPITFLPPP